MMPLDNAQVRTLLSSVAKTRDLEIDCNACLASLAEFAETELVGTDLPEALQLVEGHLRNCTECTEEFDALLEILRSSAGVP